MPASPTLRRLASASLTLLASTLAVSVAASTAHAQEAGDAIVGQPVELQPSASGPTAIPVRALAASRRLPKAKSGRWLAMAATMPAGFNAVHGARVSGNCVLVVAGSGNSGDKAAARDFRNLLVCAKGTKVTVRELPRQGSDFFCTVQTHDRYGNVDSYGGTATYTGPLGYTGSRKVARFLRKQRRWVARPSMADGRWYGSVADWKGFKFLAGGLDRRGLNNTRPELVAPSGRIRRLGYRLDLPLYAGLRPTTGGRLFYDGSNTWGDGSVPPMLIDVKTGITRAVPGLPDRDARSEAAALPIGPIQAQTFMVAAGGRPDRTSTASTAFVNLNAKRPRFTAGPRLPAAVAHLSGATMFDRSVLLTGGARQYQGTPAAPFALRLDPRTRKLTRLASPVIGRGYHHILVRLADGSFLAMGSNANDAIELRIDRYLPAYFFKARPKLGSVRKVMGNGSRVFVPVKRVKGAGRVSKVSLFSRTATTHQFDNGEMVVDLPIIKRTRRGVVVKVPASRFLLPPKVWDLVAHQGKRPSKAVEVRTA